MRRNPKGFGSIYTMHDGHRSKKYRAVVTLTPDPITGKRNRMTIGTYKTSGEAMEALTTYKKDPYDIDTKKMTFGEALEKWKKGYFPKLAPRTVYQIDYRLKRFIPFFERNLRGIKLIEFQSFFDAMEISASTKKVYRNILYTFYQNCIKYNFVDKNFISHIDIGKIIPVRDHKIFTPEELAVLWKHQLVRNVDIILILIYTGLRIEELLKLKKEDVNLQRHYLVGGSKTVAGKDRLVPLHHALIPIIKRRMVESTVYLIENVGGRKITYISYWKSFKELIKRIGVGDHIIHDTRHTFATIINNTGANPTSIKAIIGHKTFEMTERVYTHKEIEELIKAVDAIEIKEA